MAFCLTAAATVPPTEWTPIACDGGEFSLKLVEPSAFDRLSDYGDQQPEGTRMLRVIRATVADWKDVVVMDKDGKEKKVPYDFEKLVTMMANDAGMFHKIYLACEKVFYPVKVTDTEKGNEQGQPATP